MSGRTLDDRLRDAVRAYEALSPVDRALHDAAQRRSFLRGQMGTEPPRDVLADEVVRLRALLAECESVLGPFASDELIRRAEDDNDEGRRRIGPACCVSYMTTLGSLYDARTLGTKLRQVR